MKGLQNDSRKSADSALENVLKRLAQGEINGEEAKDRIALLIRKNKNTKGTQLK